VPHKRCQIEKDLVVSFVAFEVFVRTLPGDSILEDSRRISHQARQEHKGHKVFLLLVKMLENDSHFGLHISSSHPCSDKVGVRDFTEERNDAKRNLPGV
jgi:hypothetical protein